MEGKGNFVILLFIVAILTLTLAVLAGYLFLVAPSSTPKTITVVQTGPKIPTEDELTIKQLYTGKTYFNLKTTDDSQISVIQAGISIKYYKKVKGVKSTDNRITAYDAEIKEIIGTYFQNLTIEDVKLPEVKTKAKKDLTQQLNDILTESDTDKQPIIYTVIFDQWFYQ